MRCSRLFAAIPFSLLVAVPALHAQEAKLFQDSWFWGIHGGGTTIGTPARSTATVPTVGGEWFITRTSGGLYAAYDQANFTGISQVADAGSTTGTRAVRIRNLRTVSIAALAFPFQANGFRPYAGLGLALSTIGGATAERSAAGDTVSADSQKRADDGRSRSGLLVLGGVQYQIQRTAIFGQFSSTTRNTQFLIDKPVMSFTAGVRYNFGSSIER